MSSQVNTADDRVAVIGAGIVGMAAALYMQRAGLNVTVFDPLPTGGGASYGNAGMLSPDSCTPRTGPPNMLRKVPGWLRDPLGPLAIRPTYFPRAVPWLMKWAAAGQFDNVMRGSDALRALNVPAFECYRELLGGARYNELIRATGQIYYWEGEASSEKVASKDRVGEAIKLRHGTTAEPLEIHELRQLVPALTRSVTRAIFLPKNGHTVSPGRLVTTLGHLFQEDGGHMRHESVAKLLREGDGYRLVTNVANHMFGKVVVSAGAYSQRLLKPLGFRFPLETQRGYHVDIARSNIIPPSMPVVCSNKPSGVSPIDGGIRFAGSVEIAGLDAPMNEARALNLLRRGKEMLPGLQEEDYSIWMGHRPSLPDGLPVIGAASGHKGLFLAFGHGHSGLTGGPQTGRLVAQLVMEKEPFIDLKPFSPTRFGSSAASRI